MYLSFSVTTWPFKNSLIFFFIILSRLGCSEWEELLFKVPNIYSYDSDSLFLNCFNSL